MLYKKLSFKNKLSFHRFYIFRDFIFISIGPLREESLDFTVWFGRVDKVIKF